MNKKKVTEFNLIDHIKRYFSIMPYQPIIQWCQKNIDFSQQVSAQRNKLDFASYPYQVPILKEWQNEKKTIKTIVVVAPQQIGKTNLFVCGLLWNMVFNPCQSMVVYPSDKDAIDANQIKLLPLMKHIPYLKKELQKPRSYRSDCYKFSNLVSYFQGAGSKIVSKSCKIVVGDEVDAWPPIAGIDNVADLKKRTRSYNSSICFLISTPRNKDDKIWQNFLKGSQGYWYLRCKGCGELTMRSCDTNNLQFQSDVIEEANERVVRPDSIRLICPVCKHEHVEADKVWMNQNGAFKHLIPQRLDTHPSFQIGGLASQLPAMSWQNIANAQLEAGKRNLQQKQRTFDNSFKGLPFKPRLISKEDIEELREHEWKPNEAPRREDIEMVFITADTQDDRSVVGVWAFDVNDNLYLIKADQPNYLMLDQAERERINQLRKEQAAMKGIEYTPVVTVQDMYNAEYFVQNDVGIKPSFIFLDRRGHRAKDIDTFIRTHKWARAWLGSKLQSIPWKPSKDIENGILANAIHYQEEAIWYLHTQKRRNNEYLFFYPEIEQRVLDQMAACKPDPNRNFGHEPANWTFQNRPHDWFDVLKMACFARQWVIQNSYPNIYRFCKSPRLKEKFEKKLKAQKEQEETQKKPDEFPKQKWLQI